MGRPVFDSFIRATRGVGLGHPNEVADWHPRASIDGDTDVFEEGGDAVVGRERAPIAVAVRIDRSAMVTTKHVAEIPKWGFPTAEAVFPQPVHHCVHLISQMIVENTDGRLALGCRVRSPSDSGHGFALGDGDMKRLRAWTQDTEPNELRGDRGSLQTIPQAASPRLDVRASKRRFGFTSERTDRGVRPPDLEKPVRGASPGALGDTVTADRGRARRMRCRPTVDADSMTPSRKGGVCLAPASSTSMTNSSSTGHGHWSTTRSVPRSPAVPATVRSPLGEGRPVVRASRRCTPSPRPSSRAPA